jgi:hypothetical protein
MQLQNTTIVILERTQQGGLRVAKVIANPQLAEKDGKPVIGPFARRLMTVKEIAVRDGLSLNKASAKRAEQPLLCLADFPGQVPVQSLLRSPEEAA